MILLPPGLGGEPARPRIALRILACIFVVWGLLLTAVTESPWALLVVVAAAIATYVF